MKEIEPVRNIFDQYSQPENKLTHALVCALSVDRSLLRPFLKWLGASPPRTFESLTITEQQRPGIRLSADDESEESFTLPDACLFDDDDWLLMIEAKVQARIDKRQLDGHVKSAHRQDFSSPQLLIIAVDEQEDWRSSPYIFKSWREIYAWFRRHITKSPWATEFTEYLEIFETRMTSQDYSIRGTLTMFDGLQFDSEDPFNYREAKPLIGLLGDELRQRSELGKLGADLGASGRSKMTGKKEGVVWDFIPLKNPHSSQNLTHYPHLTFSLRSRGPAAMFNIPNAVKGGLRKRLIDLGEEEFKNMLIQIEHNLRPVLRRTKNCKPLISIVQRHYPTRISPPVLDAELYCDLRTLVANDNSGVKYQPEWIDSLFQILANKKSNIQIGITTRFDYDCPRIRSAEAVDIFVESWVAMRPVVEFARPS